MAIMMTESIGEVGVWTLVKQNGLSSYSVTQLSFEVTRLFGNLGQAAH